MLLPSACCLPFVQWDLSLCIQAHTLFSLPQWSCWIAAGLLACSYSIHIQVPAINAWSCLCQYHCMTHGTCRRSNSLDSNAEHLACLTVGSSC